MKFGTFLAPFHTKRSSPTVALERDIEMVTLMDRLGYDEAWVGEHHSGGVELICSPELMIATLAERTRSIRLGTGVISLSYHHPLNVVERMVLLDHLTHGRVMMGVGPGALAIDAYQRGIDPADQRRRMAESLEVIVELLRGEGLVNRSTDWFTIREGHLHMVPYQGGKFEIAVAAMLSPSGPSLAGRLGASLLSFGSSMSEGGAEGMRRVWDVYEKTSAENGFVADRRTWRVVIPWHVAPTKEQAMSEVEYGLLDWLRYEHDVAHLPFASPEGVSPRQAVEAAVAAGSAIIGSPDDAIEQIRAFQESSGGFGVLLNMDADWAPHAAKLRSNELFAAEVIPAFSGRSAALDASYHWGERHHDEIKKKVNKALADSTKAYFGDDHAVSREISHALGVDEGTGRALSS